MRRDSRARSGDSAVNDGGYGLGEDRNLGLNGSYTKSDAIGGRFPGDDQSEEEILGPDFQQSQQRSDDDGLEQAILVTEEYQVTSSRAHRPEE